MFNIEIAFRAIDALGTAAFAISGAMVAAKKRNDLFGILLMAAATALGGGMMRDMVLGIHPPLLFRNWLGLSISAGMALAVFCAIRFWHELYAAEEEKVEKINDIVDALGLGSFTVTGCQVAIQAGFADNPFLVVSMGALTAAGGGMLRDVILNNMPFILVKQIYASAAILGASLYYLAVTCLDASTVLAALLGILTTFILRVLAQHYHWRLPHATPVRR